jgi:formimidoylglutamate deiminase
MQADFVALDLNHPMLAGWHADDLLDALFFGASVAVIKQVWVQGKLVLTAI